MAIVTISRGTYSGGKMLAECLAERLNYRCISRELIVETSKRYGVTQEKLHDALVSAPSILERMSYERDQYLAFMQAVLCEMVKDDNVVYHGYAGHFLLKGITHVLRVRIIADMRFRIKLAMDHQNLEEKEAVQYIQKIDKQREKWIRVLYGINWNDPMLFDMVFNLETIGIPLACEIIRYTLEQPDFQSTPESQKILENLLLASKVRAALAADPKSSFNDFTISADDGTVSIQGKTRSQSAVDYIIGVIRNVPGVRDVHNIPTTTQDRND